MIDLPLALVSRLRTLPATGGLYPNNLACCEVADGAIGGALFADEFEIIALPLAALTESLSQANLKQQNSPMTLKQLFQNVQPSELDDPPLLARYFAGNPGVTCVRYNILGSKPA